MKIAHKLTLAVMALCFASPLMAAGTWTFYPSGDTSNYIYNCVIGPDTSIYYSIPNWSTIPSLTVSGIYKVKLNNPSIHTNLLKYLPINLSASKRNGVYWDNSRDSLYIGGIDGQVYRGRDTVFTALPSIPLLYSRIDPTGFYLEKLTHVTDFSRDSKGRLLAATDSLIWYLDTVAQEWKPIGNSSLYPGDLWWYTEIFKHPNGMVFAGGPGFGQGYPMMVGIDSSLSIHGFPNENFWGVTIGSSQTFYSAFGTGQTYEKFSPGKNFSMDTTWLHYPSTEFYTSQVTGTSFEDPSGLLWVGQGTRIDIVKGDSILLQMPQYSYDVPVKFFVAQDSSFWACTGTGLIKYSQKYALPTEVLSSTMVKNSSTHRSKLRLSVEPGGVTISSSSTASIRIFSPQGLLVWHGDVLGSKTIPLAHGIWFVNCSSEHQVIAIP